MKTIDFSFNGGIPMDQDRMDWLQQSYLSAIRALAGMGGADSYIISGCQLSGSDPDFDVAVGWIYHNGEVYYCPGGSVTTVDGGTTYDVGFLITELSNEDRALEYYDGSTHLALSDKMAIPSRVPFGSTNTSVRIRYQLLKRGLAPYSPYSDVFDATASTTTDSGAVAYTVRVKARLNTLTSVVEMALQVKVTGANSIGVSLPDMRAVDTTIDLPWSISGCPVEGVPTALLGITTIITTGVAGGVLNNSSQPVQSITAQVYGTRIYLNVPKMRSANTNFVATGKMEVLLANTW
jgi:hypothetical protein